MTEQAVRARLVCGIVATPLYFAVALTLLATADGFRLGPHMLSQLATGERGGIQVANFVVTGVLFVLAAGGLRRAVGAGVGRVWLARLVTVFGLGLVAAGVLVADPANGFPAGAATVTTWHGTGHAVAAAVSGLALVAACAVVTRRALADRRPGWAAVSAGAGLVYLVLPGVAPGASAGSMLAVGSVIGWGWLSVLSARVLASRVAIAGRMSQPQPA